MVIVHAYVCLPEGKSDHIIYLLYYMIMNYIYIYIYSVLHLYLIPNSIPTIFPLYSHDIPMIFP